MFLKDYEGNVDISGNIDNDDASINDITCDGDELSHKFSMDEPSRESSSLYAHSMLRLHTIDL